MANQEHLEILKQGVEVWNRWREENPDVQPDFSNANLRSSVFNGFDLGGIVLNGADLRSVYLECVYLGDANFIDADLYAANLVDANLRGANFSGANLIDANLSAANLKCANLSKASLIAASLRSARLNGANLRGADLRVANLSDAKLESTDISDARLFETVLINLDLSNVQGLETFQHNGPSSIDHRTIVRSGQLPLSFLRGIGLPDTFIDYIPSLFNQPLQFYSCFISYSSKDEEFAKRLHADLQDKGVRCWYAPEDLPIGAKIRVGIDEAIRKHDKLLLILSEHSVNSQWVEQEVETALEKERERGQLVLFPVRLDDAFMDSRDGWTRLIKNTRNVGDFTRWKDYDAYQTGLERLVRDLKAALTAKE